MPSSSMVDNGGEPYVGPRPFRLDDRAKFFGRARDAHMVADHWQANPLTILCGPSGVGKTSLLEAGVLPLLDPELMDVLPIGRLSHGSSVPTPLLREGHNPHVFAVLSTWSPYDLPTDLSGMTFPAFLRRRPERLDRDGDPMLTLVAIDRAEALFAGTSTRPEEADDFLHQLAGAIQANSNLRVLIVIRDDQLAAFKQRVGVFKQVVEYYLDTLTFEAALEATRNPLRGTGCSLAEGAAEKLVDNLRTVRLGHPGGEDVVEVLPKVEPLQLQLVCSTMWQALPPGTTEITVDDVEDLANIDESLAAFCSRMIEEVADQFFRSQVDLLLTRLRHGFITPWGGKIVVDMGLTETAGLPNSVIFALVDRHILTMNNGHVFTMGTRSPTGTCELSHDRLIQAIMRSRYAKRDNDLIDPAEYRRLAELALQEGEFERAESLAEEALRRSGNDVRSRAESESVLGNICYQRSKLNEAVTHYRASAALLQTIPGTNAAVATLLTALGRIRIAQGRFGLALNDLMAADRRRPGDSVIQTELAWALWCQGQVTGAVDVLNAVLAREGNDEGALRVRGEIMADLGRHAEAIQDLARVKPHYSPSSRSAYALAMALAGRVKEALIALPPVERERNGTVLLRVARVQEAAGNHSLAMDFARRAREGDIRPPLPQQLASEADRLIDSTRN
ncbi:nSTAND1 domain-containing NTPase [[Actinomadura] parvosata]|uniref:nSTAND1 domain-containing NTPase n=1 Tax=[Actinomadura] parvosata TaxID=1955412 RepID=UPI00406CD696